MKRYKIYKRVLFNYYILVMFISYAIIYKEIKKIKILKRNKIEINNSS